MFPSRLDLYLLLLLLASVLSESNIIEGLCTWTVSSEERSVPPSVYPVHFYACQSGQITWRKPYGALEMTFQSGVPAKSEGTYKICIFAKTPGFEIFTRHKDDDFKLLRSGDAKDLDAEICISSQTKRAVIYVESGKTMNTKEAVLKYRTIFLGNGRGSLRHKDCKVCSREKLIKSFCSSDFAVHGNVKSVYTIGGSRTRGEAVVVAKKILHQTANIFQRTSDASEILGNVNFPLYCHWKKRSKHGFLFTGNLRGGEGPVVQCRIKFSLWRKLYHRNICDATKMQT